MIADIPGEMVQCLSHQDNGLVRFIHGQYPFHMGLGCFQNPRPILASRLSQFYLATLQIGCGKDRISANSGPGWSFLGDTNS